MILLLMETSLCGHYDLKRELKVEKYKINHVIMQESRLLWMLGVVWDQFSVDNGWGAWTLFYFLGATSSPQPVAAFNRNPQDPAGSCIKHIAER